MCVYAKEMKWISKKIFSKKHKKLCVCEYYHILPLSDSKISFFLSFFLSPLIHNHVKALFMIHLILRDFHEIEHDKWVARQSQANEKVRNIFSELSQTLLFHVNDYFHSTSLFRIAITFTHAKKRKKEVFYPPKLCLRKVKIKQIYF